MSASRASSSSSSSSVIVVGSGLAGLSATITALEAGASVTLIEKTKKFGGNSAKATSGINGAASSEQKQQNIQDSVHDFYQDTIKSGRDAVTPVSEELVTILSEQSGAAIDWLESRYGLELSKLSQCGGHSAPRTHRFQDKNGRPVPVGWTIVSTLYKYLSDPQRDFADRFTFIQNAQVSELITAPGSLNAQHVTGVRYRVEIEKEEGEGGEGEGEEGKKQEKDNNINDDDEMMEQDSVSALPEYDYFEVFANAVVLATGGFGSDVLRSKSSSPDQDMKSSSLLFQHVPEISHLPTTNGDWATGDGIRLATAVNARLLGMNKVQVHPTGFVNPKNPCDGTKMLGPEALRASGGILLSPMKGQRFVNELGLRDHVTSQIFNHGEPYIVECGESEGQHMDPPVFVYLVMNQEAVNKFGQPAISFYSKVGQFKQYDNLEALCADLDWNLDDLVEEFKIYNSQADEGTDNFDKTVFPVRFTPDEPLWVAMVTPTIHYTMGGVHFAPDGGVLDVDGNEIPGLFAAGEVTGGVHGKNRLAGNSLLECVVFGRIAGQSAANATPYEQSYEKSSSHDEL